MTVTFASVLITVYVCELCIALHYIFNFMSREISVLFIHYSCNIFHSGLAVNQTFSKDFVSGRLVRNMRPKALLFF